VVVPVVVDLSHQHKYCHVHAEDMNRRGKVSKMVPSTIETTEVELRPVTVKVMRTVMKQQAQKHSKIVSVPKEVTETSVVHDTKTRDKKVVKMVKEMRTNPVTTWNDVTTHRTAYRTVRETVMHKKTLATTKQVQE